jgi:hypothetical protein
MSNHNFVNLLMSLVCSSSSFCDGLFASVCLQESKLLEYLLPADAWGHFPPFFAFEASEAKKRKEDTLAGSFCPVLS